MVRNLKLIKMKNQVIKCITPEQGEKIIEYWKSKGVDTKGLEGNNSESDNNYFIYYGVINGIFANYSLSHVERTNSEIIELPEDEFDMTTKESRLAYARKHYPVGTRYISSEYSSKVFTVGEADDKETQYWLGTGNYGDCVLANLGDDTQTGQFICYFGKWAEIINEVKQEEKAMGTQRLSRQGLKEIHSVACANWKTILEKYGANNPLEDYIELTQPQVDTMFNSCTKEQLPIVSKYLKQDDISVDLRYINGDKHGLVLNCEYLLRVDDLEADYKSFWLNNKFNWEIKLVNGFQRLIPTKKK